MLSNDDRKEVIESAREMILAGLDMLQNAVKDTGLENTVRDRIIKVIEPITIYSDPQSDLIKDVFGIDSLLAMLDIDLDKPTDDLITKKDIEQIPEDLETSMNLNAGDDND